MKDTIHCFEFHDAKGVAICGDIHGDFNQVVYKCCIQYKMIDTIIIVAGDCGFGFEKEGYYEDVYKRNRDRLSKSNNSILFVRGNHDNPAYFNDYPINHRRWMTVPDYSVIKTCDHNILCIGGAISVDRLYRINDSRYLTAKPDNPLAKNIYWPNEHPVFSKDKLNSINETCLIDVVVTHTAPSFCELRSKSDLTTMSMIDEKLSENVRHERQVMDDVFHCLKTMGHPLHYWFYGHFHQSWHQDIDGVQFIMLDIMELAQIKSL